jgi:hypothetical protein
MQTCRSFIFLLVVISFLATACKTGSNEPEHSYEYIPLSKFTIDSNALESGSTVQIIAYSGGKQSKKNNINYFQFIVVNSASHDTVRVLTALINVPGETDKGIYTPPTMFDGNKGVFTATFEPKDSVQNMAINLSMVTGEKDRDLERVNEIMSDTSNTPSGEEWVVVNKSLPIFENTKYKTTIGTLKFNSIPW